jgi:hypothetical protein
MRPGKATNTLLWLLAAFLLPQEPSFAQGFQNEVSIREAQIGVGGVVREGDWAGLQFGITDLGDRVREVVVRVQIVDPDGDYTQYERVVATDPGDEKLVWVYANLPNDIVGDTLLVLVNEASETESGTRVGRQLGRTEIAMSRVISDRQGMVARVGNQWVGLLQYQLDFSPRTGRGGGGQSFDNSPQGEHERSRVIQLSGASQMPDRWLGLMPFSTIVWDAGPMGELGVEQAAALREWIHRGGHLVVMLGAESVNWIPNRLVNPLFDAMPLVDITRVEAVDLDLYRDMISSNDRLTLPDNQVVHTMSVQDGADTSRDAIRVFSGPDGKCVVARRLVGSGAVTFVGLDFSHRQLSAFSLPEPELFWNRVLGRRRKMVSEDDEQGLIATFSQNTVVYDQQVEQLVDKKGAAGEGRAARVRGVSRVLAPCCAGVVPRLEAHREDPPRLGRLRGRIRAVHGDQLGRRHAAQTHLGQRAPRLPPGARLRAGRPPRAHVRQPAHPVVRRGDNRSRGSQPGHCPGRRRHAQRRLALRRSNGRGFPGLPTLPDQRPASG